MKVLSHLLLHLGNVHKDRGTLYRQCGLTCTLISPDISSYPFSMAFTGCHGAIIKGHPKGQRLAWIAGNLIIAGSADEADDPQQITSGASLASGPLTLLRAKVDCRGLALLLWPAAATQQPQSQAAGWSTATATTSTPQQSAAPSQAATGSVAAAASAPTIQCPADASSPAAAAAAAAAAADTANVGGHSSRTPDNPTPSPTAQIQLPGESQTASDPAAAASFGPAGFLHVPAAVGEPLKAASAAAAAPEVNPVTTAELQQPPAAAAMAGAEPSPPSATDAAAAASKGPATSVPAVADGSVHRAGGNIAEHTSGEAASAASSPTTAMLGLPVKLVQQLLDGVEGGRYSRPK